MPFLGQILMVLCGFQLYTPVAPLGLWNLGYPRIYKPAAPLGLKCVGFHESTISHYQHDNPLKQKSQRRLGFMESWFQNENCCHLCINIIEGLNVVKCRPHSF